MLGIAIFVGLVGMAVVWVLASHEFRRVVWAEDREIFAELVHASRRHGFSLPGPWIEYAEGVELKSISNPRLRHAAARLTRVYRGLRAVIYFSPAFLLLCMLGYVLVANGI